MDKHPHPTLPFSYCSTCIFPRERSRKRREGKHSPSVPAAAANSILQFQEGTSCRLPDHSLEQTPQQAVGYNQCAKTAMTSDIMFRCLATVSNTLGIKVTPAFKGGGPHSDQAHFGSSK